MATIGIDCGASKIEFMLAYKDISHPIQTFRLPTPKNDDYNNFLITLKEGIDKLIKVSLDPVEKIGIGVPGVINPTNKIIKKSSIWAIRDKNLEKDISNLVNIKTFVGNDSKCFALSEAILGAGKNYKTLVGLIIGTGCALGYVRNKKLITGHHGMTGEIGHWVLNPNGDKCHCGRYGCIETMISGKALEKLYFKKSGLHKKASEIYEKYKINDDAAILCWKIYLENFAQVLALIINLFDPEVIVLGGGVSNLDILYDQGIKYVGKYVFSDHCHTPIIKNELGDSSGVFGACLLH
ncbi:MAG: ROK family protein [SAR324 cluster bacterium]|nr:ROK family protein [SAR324 cluster bacterium]